MVSRCDYETQLFSEELWIVETLKQIRTVRNGLEIERLHLESLKTLYSINSGENQSNGMSTTSEDNEISFNTLQTQLLQSALWNIPQREDTLDKEFECNEEELNLSVTESIPGYGEDEIDTEEEFEEEEDSENMRIDMNTFMDELHECESDDET